MNDPVWALQNTALEMEQFEEVNYREWAEFLLALQADGWDIVRSAPPPQAVQGEGGEG